MTVSRTVPPPHDYHRWQTRSVTVRGSDYQLATKPGTFSHGTLDPASVLLAERMKIVPDETLLHLNCGNGLVGSVAARLGARVVLTDRNVVAVDAARRTLAANGAPGEVILGQGSHALPPDFAPDLVAIRIPHEKFALLQLLWDAYRMLPIGGRCYIAGATSEGVKTAAGAMEGLFGTATTLAHGSGHRLVVAVKRAGAPHDAAGFDSPLLDPATFNAFAAHLRGRDYTLFSRPGVFSWDHLDEATALLAETMDVRAGDRVLDLGCGVGALGLVAGSLTDGGPICMVDADVEAVRSSERSAMTAGLANVRCLTSDVAAAVHDERFDVVVTNPPFHVGKATDLRVPLQFIEDAWAVLAPGGRLNLVANRTLPYEGAIQRRFGNLATLHDGPRFKVLSATR